MSNLNDTWLSMNERN